MIDYPLSDQQMNVISALSSGANMKAAAEQAGVHRNTIAWWRRNHHVFQIALAGAQYDRALVFREKTEDLVEIAAQTLRDILTDPKAPASVRLRAALAVMQTASTPPDPKKQVLVEIEKFVPNPTPPVLPPDPLPQSVHKNAQCAPPEEPQNLHKVAQTIRRESPKVGRNELCPCGSGQKYKRCCLDKPQAASSSASSR